MLRSRRRNRAGSELSEGAAVRLPLLHSWMLKGLKNSMSALLKLSPVVTKPRLSVRGAATFIRLPAVEQMRLLHDQKYPRQAPQVFKQPYYAPPLKGIREFLERGTPGLLDARAQLQGLRIPSRRMHCMRVLESFVQSEHANRGLKPVAIPRLYAHMRGLELRLSPDLVAQEGNEDRYMYFNASAKQFDPETARLTLEFAHWLLRENGIEIKPKQVEFIDLFTGVLYPGRAPRKSTLRNLDENARLIESMWPTIDP